MKSRPILFSAPMIQALLADRKTQTRRYVREQGWWSNGEVPAPIRLEADKMTIIDTGYGQVSCPYGKPGDLLWVRERLAGHVLTPGKDSVHEAVEDGEVEEAPSPMLAVVRRLNMRIIKLDALVRMTTGRLQL